jgi:uncharacterized protein (TIGR02466 family)
MDAVNRELGARLLAEKRASRGVSRSNVGGWHSLPNLSSRAEPCYHAVIQEIVNHVCSVTEELAADANATTEFSPRCAVHGWATILHDGDYMILHDHAEAHWSSAYYVDAGDDAPAHPESGRLAFVDPRRGSRSMGGIDLFPSTFTVRPRTGMLVVFPGWLQHYVHAYRGARPRICISCNVKLEPTAPPPA